MKKTRREFSPAFKLEAVRKVEIAIGQNPVGAIARTAASLDIAESVLRNWMEKAGVANPSSRALKAAASASDDTPDVSRDEAGRRVYSARFKERAIEAVLRAIREDEPGPIDAVADAIKVHTTVLRGWLAGAGYGIGGRTPSGAPSVKLDMMKLRDAALGRTPAPAPTANVPAVARPAPSESRRATPLQAVPTNADIMTAFEQLQQRNEALERENAALTEELRRLRGEREVFIAASTILGTERRAG